MNKSEVKRAIDGKDKPNIYVNKKSNGRTAMIFGILNSLGVNISDAFEQAQKEVTQ